MNRRRFIREGLLAVAAPLIFTPQLIKPVWRTPRETQLQMLTRKWGALLGGISDQGRRETMAVMMENQARALGADAPPLAHALGQIPHVMYETPAFGTLLVSGLLDAVRYERILKGTIT